MLQEQVPPGRLVLLLWVVACGGSRGCEPHVLVGSRVVRYWCSPCCTPTCCAPLARQCQSRAGFYQRLFAELENYFKPTVCRRSGMPRGLIYLCTRWLHVELTGSIRDTREALKRGRHGRRSCLFTMPLFTQETRRLAIITCTQFSDGVVECFSSFSFYLGTFWCHVWRNYLSRLCSSLQYALDLSFNLLHFNLRECSLLHVLFVLLMLGLYRYLDFFLN